MTNDELREALMVYRSIHARGAIAEKIAAANILLAEMLSRTLGLGGGGIDIEALVERELRKGAHEH